jgi:hypothetical protein
MPASDWGLGSAGSTALQPPSGEQYRHAEKTLEHVMELAQSWPQDAVEMLCSCSAAGIGGVGRVHATRASRRAIRIMD